jgi:hypothetical protein
MATRSNIAVLLKDGTVKKTYCHYDGYPEHNGKILLDCYSEYDKAVELVSLGDLSILGNLVHPDPEVVHTFNHPQPNVCVAYGRDRGDTNTDAATFEKYEHYVDSVGQQDYDYLFKNDSWYIFDSYRLITVEKHLSLRNR